jgi:methionine-rich copper-binding protein CopC
MAVEAPQQRNEGIRTATVGMMLSEITPVDSSKEVKKAPEKIEVVTTHSVGLISPPPPITGDTIINAIEPVEEIVPIKESCKPLDTVTVASSTGYQTGRLVSGGISVVTTKVISEDIIRKEIKEDSFSIKAYPNPVKAGGQLTISVTSNESISRLQLVAASGASFPLANIRIPKSGLMTVTIPDGLAAGTYFLQIVMNNQKSKTVKLILLN